MNLALIGYRGTGKSEVARHVAARLGWPWFDSDQEIERRAGKSISAIFADDGEAEFRDLESQVVAELARRDRSVLSLGGGAVLREENRDVLAALATIVWLTASPETLWQRISADPVTAARRPNLTTAGGITEIVATLAARSSIYRACADFEVDTEQRTPAEVADAILAQLNHLDSSDKAT